MAKAKLCNTVRTGPRSLKFQVCSCHEGNTSNITRISGMPSTPSYLKFGDLFCGHTVCTSNINYSYFVLRVKLISTPYMHIPPGNCVIVSTTKVNTPKIKTICCWLFCTYNFHINHICHLSSLDVDLFAIFRKKDSQLYYKPPKCMTKYMDDPLCEHWTRLQNYK